MTISFLFRKPRFPIICDIDGYVISAKSISGFEKQLSAYNICKESRYPIIDITGEGWSFYPEHMAISPLTKKKKWFKKEVIAIFNNRKAIAPFGNADKNVATELIEVNMGKKSRKKKERREKVKNQNSHTKKAIIVHPITEAIPKEIVQKSSVDEQFQRIYNIFGVSDGDDAEVNMENLKKYLEYLKDNIETPCIVTGIEDMGCFGWEEYYNLGPGSEREYNKLKKKYPSFTDEYTLLGFHDDFDEEEGLYVDVQRISDKKKFSLTLADLEGVDKNSKNAQLIHDHSVWFVNFR